jgi:lipopolysaccharide heptosyltransferase II
MSARVIVRLPNWLGDTVMAVPALRALRRGRPEARILAAGPWASTLAGQSLADVLVTYPRAWSGRLRAADTVREFGGDTTIILPNSSEAALTAWYWGAPRRIGFADGARSWLLSDPVGLPSPRGHQIDEYLMLVERLGVEVQEREPHLEPPAPDAESRRCARALLREAGDGAVNRPLIGVHVGAAYGSAKVWPAERVVELCRRLDAAGAVGVLMGAQGDTDLAHAIAAEAPACNLVGRDHPDLLAALLAEVHVLVSGDTGVAHLAAALGTPVVTLFGPTDPRLTAPRGPALILRHVVPCAPCFYRVCPIEHPCLRSIDAATVATVALGRTRTPTESADG